MADWRTKPKEELMRMIDMHGQPDIISEEPNGLAVWTKQTILDADPMSPLHELVVRDEPEIDEYIYSYIEIGISDIDFIVIRSISDSIFYDFLKNILGVRGDSFEHNIATLRTITAYLSSPYVTTNNRAISSAYSQIQSVIMDTDLAEISSEILRDISESSDVFIDIYNDLYSDLKDL